GRKCRRFRKKNKKTQRLSVSAVRSLVAAEGRPFGNPIRKKEAVPPCFFSLARKVDGGIESFGAIDATCISHGQFLARVMVRVLAFFYQSSALAGHEQELQ